MSDLTLDYAKRDPQEMLASLKQQLTEFTGGVWTDFTENDLGYALIKAFIELSDFNNFYLDSNIAENFLSLCSLRESAVRAAKMLNYIPTKAAPSEVSVQLTHPGFNYQLIIPADSLWTINNKTFICPTPISIPQGQQTTLISLLQGTRYILNTTANGGSFFRLTIPTNSSEIEVRVNGELWSAIDSFIGVFDKKSYKIYEDVDGQVIMFEANINAFKPNSGDLIEIRAILTDGASGNLLSNELIVAPISTIQDPESNDITNAFNGATTTAAVGGTDVEATDSIRVNAPAFYSTQGRLVTASDYEAYLRKTVALKDVIVIGGQDINRYGEVHIVVFPESPAFQPPDYLVDQDYLDSIKEAVKDLNIITVTVFVKAPIPVEVSVIGTIGASTKVYNEFATPTNLAAEQATDFFDTLRIGQSVYMSEFTAPITSLNGIDFVDASFSIKSIAISQSGLITIPMIQNFDVSDVILTRENNIVVFEGDGTQYVKETNFVFTEDDLINNDEQCILSYKGVGNNLLLSPDQVAILEQLQLTTQLLQ